MTNCTSVESLIYQYREGELNALERSTLLRHLGSCGRCAELHRQLLAMDAALGEARGAVPGTAVDPGCVDRTLDRIAPRRRGVRRRASPSSFLDALFGRMQPGLSVALIALSVVFLVQESRDARLLSELEERLQAGGAEHASAGTLLQEAGDQFRRAFPRGTAGSAPSSPFFAGAAPVNDLLGLLGPGAAGRIGRGGGLFEDFSRRYPGLASVDPDDGIDDRERAILATEGTALLNEIEHMMQEGERR